VAAPTTAVAVAAAAAPAPAVASTAAPAKVNVNVTKLKALLSSRLWATGKRVKADYRNQRTALVNGKTVQEAGTCRVPDSQGGNVLYKYSDITYDINNGMLRLGDTEGSVS
jgi:hypothetical protein